MLLDEVKATLAMENLSLNEEQEKLLKSYADGKITLKEYQELLFCDANFIEKELNKLFLKLKSENYLKDCTEDNIASKAAYYLGEINAIHPFREGNGRTQREFIRELLLPTGFYVDYSRCNAKMMLYASINAFAGDYTLMTELFDKCIVRKPLNQKT